MMSSTGYCVWAEFTATNGHTDERLQWRSTARHIDSVEADPTQKLVDSLSEVDRHLKHQLKKFPLNAFVSASVVLGFKKMPDEENHLQLEACFASPDARAIEFIIQFYQREAPLLVREMAPLIRRRMNGKFKTPYTDTLENFGARHRSARPRSGT